MSVFKQNLMGKRLLSLSLILFALGITFGAFGAHYIKNNYELKLYETFKTGSIYHLLYSLYLILASLINLVAPNKNFSKIYLIGLAGICLFSGNCYLYAVTGIKAFALIVPLGGLCLIICPLYFVLSLQKDQN